SLKWARVVLLYAGLAALAVAFTAGEWLGLVIAAAPLVLNWWLRIRTTTPPAVLLLGASTHSSIRRQQEVKARVSPLRVVSLLEVDIPWDRGLGPEMALDCFRTSNEDDWWAVITRLLEMAPVIVIDAAAETAGVLREAKHILTTGIERKCLFMTPPDGSAPVLDGLLPAAGPVRQKLRLARYEEAPRVIAAMVAELGGARAGEPRSRE
ncbi:MAG TPA: hypothetical protein VD861_13085, partial [Pyrinomonadaceae bacterium]|nr:hypothetical protein [Pyrinomonadaceae bacterium]